VELNSSTHFILYLFLLLLLLLSTPEAGYPWLSSENVPASQ
jgi:hypothetical protein